MKKRHLIFTMLLMLIMALFIIPTASAAPDCGAGPGPGVDWSGCDKTNMDFTGADLSDMIMIGTDFTGSTFDGTDFTGSDVTGAIMRDAPTGIGVVEAVYFIGASVQGLDMTGSTAFVFASFEGAIGEPILPAVPPAVILIECPPGGVFANNIDTFCAWNPTAVSLIGMNGAAAITATPFYVAGALGVLGIATALLIAGLQRRREAVLV